MRTFNKSAISESVIKEVRDYINKVDNPLRIPIEFQILDAKEHGLSSPVIIGADTYVAAKYKKVPKTEIAFGYAFEKFILFATSLGLGTVWLAATIDRKTFEKAIELKEGEVMPAVSPIGYAAEKRSIRENLMRKGMKSDDRLSFERLLQKVDLGIAICHFEIAANEQGLKGSIIQKDPGIAVPDNTEYIATYELEE